MLSSYVICSHIVSLLFFLMSCQLYSSRWVSSSLDTETGYMYAPGVLGSEIQMGRYCPRFIGSTGEVITCSKGIEVIKMPALGCNFTEINLKKINKVSHRDVFFIPAKRIFTNVLLIPHCVTWYAASYLSNFLFGFTIERPKGRAIKESLSMYWADPTKINLAQDKDLAAFKQMYNDFLVSLNKKDTPEKSVVLYGTSRGAATIFNFTALHHPKHVDALVCEGLFDSIEHVKDTCSFYVRWIGLILYRICQFDRQGVAPIQLVERMPRTMPILLITSRNDSTVPSECTINMYNQLRATGHDKVHILIVQKASHISYPHGNEKKECKLYENVVHAFYKKYGLPYIPEYADKGEEYFMAMTQPKVCS